MAEGLGLWVARERERPRPEGEEARRLESLRLLCCRLLALAFEQLQAAADASGRAQTHNPAGLQEGLQAGAWLLSDDSDHPLSYLNVCDILDFPTARGRDWARQLLTAIEEGRRRATTPMTNTSKGQGYPGCRSRALFVVAACSAALCRVLILLLFLTNLKTGKVIFQYRTLQVYWTHVISKKLPKASRLHAFHEFRHATGKNVPAGYLFSCLRKSK